MKSTNESRHITALEPVWGCGNGTEKGQKGSLEMEELFEGEGETRRVEPTNCLCEDA